MTTNQQNREEWEDEFDKWMKEPDVTNSGSNSPKMWQFEGYIAAKKEAKQFIQSTLQSAAEEAYKKGFIDGSDSTGEQAEEIHAIALDKAKKEAREEVIKAIKIERIRPKSNSDYDIGFSMGWNTAEDTIRNEIKQLTTN